MNSKKLAALVALALSAGLAGCAAQSDADDESQDDAVTAPADESNAVANDEKTGEAADKCGFGGWGGWGGCGGFGGWGGWGGCGGWGGWGGFGGCGLCGGFGIPFWGGCGGFGGWGGCGGFGGCW